MKMIGLILAWIDRRNVERYWREVQEDHEKGMKRLWRGHIWLSGDEEVQ